MSKIFDNIETKFEEGLHAILTNVGVERADFCVGYFNLRGWKQVAADIDKLPGGDALEKNAKGVVEPVARVCRLLIGMHRPRYQITAVADGVLCGLVGKIVARLGENCKRLLGDGFDRAGVGRGLA